MDGMRNRSKCIIPEKGIIWLNIYIAAKITLDDKLIEACKRINYEEAPDGKLFQSLIDLEYEGISNEDFKKLTDEQISDTIHYYMDLEVRTNRG